MAGVCFKMFLFCKGVWGTAICGFLYFLVNFGLGVIAVCVFDVGRCGSVDAVGLGFTVRPCTLSRSGYAFPGGGSGRVC